MKVFKHKNLGRFLLITAILLRGNFAVSQTSPVIQRPFFSTLIDNLELRQSFGAAETKKEPVKFQFTLPKDADDSFLIDGAVGIPFFDASLTQSLKVTGKLIGEYHRNTLVDEEQYTWQAGFSTTLRTKIRRNKMNTTYSQFIFTPTLKYARNVIDTVNSLLFTMDIIPFRSTVRGINLSTYTIRGNRKLISLVSIVPAIEFQNNFNVQNDADNGNILRSLLKLQYSIGGNKTRFPVTRMIEPIKTWEASVDYTLRYALINSTLSHERYTNLLETGVDYYFSTAPVSIAFGISFNYGSDPLQGLRKQQYWLATLSIQK